MDDDLCGAEAPACPGAELWEGADLTLLVHRAALGVRTVIDVACRAEGLSDGRDWLVLDAVSGDQRRTQLELARTLGIDKTTLTAVLDRLERAGLVVRRPDPCDRRARLPEATAAGRTTRDAVARARDELHSALLADVAPDVQDALRALLLRLSRAGERTPAGAPP